MKLFDFKFFDEMTQRSLTFDKLRANSSKHFFHVYENCEIEINFTMRKIAKIWTKQ